MTDKTLRLMPESRDLGRSYASMMMAPIYRYTKPEPEHAENRFGYRKVMGFFLPSWQRDSVWTEKQKISFIESAWLGINLGTYTHNVGKIGSPYDNLLIDGQQRMTAIQDYIEGKFPVFGYFYYELPTLDIRVIRFGHVFVIRNPFRRRTVSSRLLQPDELRRDRPQRG